MLTLPIKRKWFDKILTGEKLEEYREVKPYYTMRFRKFITVNPCVPDRVVEQAFRDAAEHGGYSYFGVHLRNGYSAYAPEMVVKGRIMIRTGCPEWGAVPGREYYVLSIEHSEVLNPGLPADRRKRRDE